MESKVKYMTAEEIRGLPTSEIASMTMLSGDVIIIGPNSQQDLSKSRQLFTKCDNQSIPSVQGFSMQGSNENVILRAKKETTVKEEDGVEKVQETVEIDVEPQPEGEDKKQEPLRGPDGKLLNDILTGQDYGEQEQEQQPPLEPQPQTNEAENQQNNYPNPQEEQGQYYAPEYDPNQIQQTAEEQQQYAPEENNNGYEGQEQYYPPEDQYYDQEQEQEQYPAQDLNQQVPEQYVEPNAENEYYPQEYMVDPNNPEQNNMYPGFEDENNQQYPPQEYQQPMNVPEQQGYNPEGEPMVQPPYQEPIQPSEQQPVQPVQPETYPSETQPIVQPEVQPPVQQPIQPEIQPPAEQTVQPVVPPVQQPIQPPVQQPIQPPSQKPIQPSVRPQIPKQLFPGQKPGIKIIPQPSNKRSVVQIKFGFDPRIPHRPGMRPMGPMVKLFPQPPHRPQPKRQAIGIGFIPQSQPATRIPIGGKKRIIIKPINPIGKIMDFVHDVMSPMAVRRVGLRSTNPNAVVKTAQKEDVKEGAQQGTVLRARKQEYAPQEEVLCPECACEECYGNQNQYASQYGYNNQYGQNYTTKVFRGRGVQYGPCKNFNYHEIVETSDNSKTHVVVKKGGITIKPTQ